MRSWCLKGLNSTVEKSVSAARNPHRIVKSINVELSVLGLQKQWERPGWEAGGCLFVCLNLFY